jgi:hypothetical protein
MENKRDNKIIIVPIMIFLVFAFSIIGFNQLEHEHGKEFSLIGVIYATLSFFTLENMRPEEVTENVYLLLSKYLAAAVFGYGLYSLFYQYIGRQFTRYKIKYTYHNHVIVFSAKLVGTNFLSDLLTNKYKVILVEGPAEDAWIEKIGKNRVIVLKERDFGTKFFDTLVVTHASTCVVAFENDSLNVELSLKLIRYLRAKEHRHTVRILTHIEDSNNLEVIKDYIDVSNADEKFDLEIFNIHSAAAKKIYDHFPPHNYFNFKTPDNHNAIAVVGFNQAAEDFIIENLILSHYKDGRNIKIYLVDKEADNFLFQFQFKYPFYKEFVDIVAVKLLNNKFFANFNWSKELIEKLSKVKAVYFFGDRGSELMNMAARFRQFLSGQTTNYLQTPIVICYPEDISIMKLLDVERENEESLSNTFKHQLNINFVNMITDTCTSSRLLEESEYIDLLSRVINYYYSIKYEFEWVLKEKWQITDCHDLITSIDKKWHDLSDKNAVLTEHELEHMVLERIADYTKKSVGDLKVDFGIKKWWDHLSYHKKSANRYAARHLAVKINIMKHIGCFPLNRENILHSFPVIAPIEHKRWSAEKMALNYRYGPLPQERKAKNIAKEILKIHDQLIPYDKLDDENKEKDLNIFLLMPLLNSLRVEIKK